MLKIGLARISWICCFCDLLKMHLKYKILFAEERRPILFGTYENRLF
uniref:Uncharacterized protein n=1 Tax=Arundo donax TaxID=35708 RepID=A0A0A9HTA8_ARUDO